MIYIGTKKNFEKKYMSRNEVNKIVEDYEKEVATLQNDLNYAKQYVKIYSAKGHYFSFGLGDTVYDVQFKNKSGKFSTNETASKKTSTKIIPITITDKNIVYVNERIEAKEMFATKEDAQEFIDSLKQ